MPNPPASASVRASPDDHGSCRTRTSWRLHASGVARFEPIDEGAELDRELLLLGTLRQLAGAEAEAA
jgi:hypothetical protein